MDPFTFYLDRLRACPSYGFVQGHAILRLITRCAFWDSFLTTEQFATIINLANTAHIKMMEDNYNAGWNQ